MLRYEGTFNVVCRQRINGGRKLVRVSMGDIQARSRKQAKRIAKNKFGIDCDKGSPVVTFVKGEGWREQFKNILRRGRYHEKAPASLTAEQREARDLRNSMANAGIRKDISTTERKTRRDKGKQARQSRKRNR